MIYIKKENARKWLIENLIHEINPQYQDEYTHYNLLKDEILITKEAEHLFEKDHLTIEVEDNSKFSRKPLINKYTYLTEEYDSVSLKATLIDFKIIVVEQI